MVVCKILGVLFILYGLVRMGFSIYAWVSPDLAGGDIFGLILIVIGYYLMKAKSKRTKI